MNQPPATITVQVRLFAGQRDIVGQPVRTLQLPHGATVAVAWQHLVRDYPRLSGYTGRVMNAVNHEYSDPDAVLHDGDELAFIPPVSGGSSPPAPFVITDAPLEPTPLVQLVQTPHDGAVVTFAGVVRDNFEGRATARLTYEAYTDMALATLNQIAAEARARFAIGQVAVHHRVGVLEIGETAVLVVVAAPHRQAAFEAAAYIMDRIKQITPIWKQEHWADGAHEWRE
jgi:molybdopterin synthase catalytic subunit